MRLLVLGCGIAVPYRGRMASGYALRSANGAVLQLECGPGSSRRWPIFGIDWDRWLGVVVTHHHVDHCAELVALRFARNQCDAPLGRPLWSVGPRGHRALWERLEAAFGEQIADRRGEWRVLEMDEGDRLSIGPFTVQARRVRHVEGALGVRVQCDGRTLAFSGDSAPCEALVELCRQADLALLECSHPAGRSSDHHLNAADAARIARAAGARALALTHRGPCCEGEALLAQVRAAGYEGPVVLLEDGDQLDV